jgi:periplasmic divalent cation tolerance protein
MASSTSPADTVLILTTAPADDRAEEWARALVEERLAACVNVHGQMLSIYRWKGTVEREPERQLVIKSSRARVDAVRARLRQLHSYELPELLIMTVDGGSEEYLAWIAAQTAAPPAGGAARSRSASAAPKRRRSRS